MLGYKVAQIVYQELPKSNHTSFYLKGDTFQSSSKCLQIFGLVLQENLSQKIVKKRPIWSC